MSFQEYPFILGTAGHIDHGKTALVRALSGIECDRLSEEKKRGMTIELGFAPLVLPSGKTISIVDVPGHEKFIRQMVAGAAGIDAVMLVVAADDGVMPQTKEHLEILTLLGIKNGITVINKVDLVDEEMLEIAEDDVRSLIAGTFLEKHPIMHVSAITGQGIDELKAALQKMVDASKQRSRDGAFFLPIDRAFHISGFGTVITGTAFNGVLKEGDEVEILPSKIISKVRSVQVHGESVKNAFAGQRVAVNLSNAALDDVKRGDVIAASGCFAPTECVDVFVSVLPSLSEPVEHWQRLRLHIGTSDVVVRISLLDRDKILPGEGCIAQLLPEEPITVAWDSHFILRTYSPLKTVAGGRVLLPLAERPKSKAAKASLVTFLNTAAEDISDRDRLLALIQYKGVLTQNDAKILTEIDSHKLLGHISSLESKDMIGVIKSGEAVLVSLQKMQQIKDKLCKELDAFHKSHPERKGMGMEEVCRAISETDSKFVKELMKLFARKEWIAIDDDRIKLIDFEPFDETRFMGNVTSLRSFAEKCGYSLPTIEESSAALKIDGKEMNRILSYLKERKELTILRGEFMLFAKTESDFKEILKNIEGEITLAAVRDLTGSSRKYTLPMLEHFDTKGVTRRVGDKRILLKKQ